MCTPKAHLAVCYKRPCSCQIEVAQLVLAGFKRECPHVTVGFLMPSAVMLKRRYSGVVTSERLVTAQ